MAPEQIRGHPSQRTDVYAASVVLWEMLTSERLFRGETDPQTLENVLTLEVAAPGVLDALDVIVLRGLGREQGDRFATAREMALALEASLTVASPAEVGEWVERVAEASLKERARLVASVERSAIALPAAPEKSEPEPAGLAKRKGALIAAAAALAVAAAV